MYYPLLSMPCSADSIDTPAVLRHMRELVGAGNTYLKTKENHCDVVLLMTVAKYLTDMFKVGNHDNLHNAVKPLQFDIPSNPTIL